MWKSLKCLLVAINAKYIHSNLAVYNLKACADRDLSYLGADQPEVVLAEYTINHHAAELLDDIYLEQADVLCFSCYIWNIDHVKQLVRNLKKICPKVPIWLGGPEVSYETERVMAEIPEADGLMVGEGEYTFPKLLAFLQGKGELPDGIVMRAGEKPVSDALAASAENGLISTGYPKPLSMDDIPFVYQDMKEFENKIIYYESSRGCPFRCSYCLSSIDKHIRFRSWQLVEKELAFFLEHKVPQVKFVDRTFNCRKDHCMQIWQYIADHDNGVTNFHFEIAADLLTEEEIALIRTMRPGLIQLEIGVQSTNPATIEAIRRVMDLTVLKRVVAAVHEGKNVHQHLDLIAGLPYEDYETFGRSFDEVYAMKPSQLQLGFLKVLKGSFMYEDAKRHGILYQTEAPFEVLETPWLPHSDVIRLKSVENMVEIFYNSNQFEHTLAALMKEYDRPFRFFEAVGKAYAAHGMQKMKHARGALYEFLLEFAGEEYRELLTLDFYLRENAKKRPEWAAPQEGFKDLVRELIQKHFPEEPVKQILNRYHIETFAASGEPRVVLFDYEDRDPLTGNARTRTLN